jgi:hypothetical protein
MLILFCSAPGKTLFGKSNKNRGLIVGREIFEEMREKGTGDGGRRKRRMGEWENGRWGEWEMRRERRGTGYEVI